MIAYVYAYICERIILLGEVYSKIRYKRAFNGIMISDGGQKTISAYNLSGETRLKRKKQ